MEKLYIIESKYYQHGVIFNERKRYTTSAENANKIYEETLEAFKNDCSDMLEDKENYSINKGNRKGRRYFQCYYKYQSEASGFCVEMWTEKLE